MKWLKRPTWTGKHNRKVRFLTTLRKKTAKLQSSNSCPSTNHTSLQNKSVKEAFQDLHDRYVNTTIDRVNDNVSLIFKIFYTLILFRELAINHSQSTNTYVVRV